MLDGCIAPMFPEIEERLHISELVNAVPKSRKYPLLELTIEAVVVHCAYRI